MSAGPGSVKCNIHEMLWQPARGIRKLFEDQSLIFLDCECMIVEVDFTNTSL